MLESPLLLLSLLAASSIDDDAAPASETLAVKAERLIVRPGHELENGVLIARDGVIVAVGTDVEIPEGARTLEAPVACAGFVDGWSTLSLDRSSVIEQRSEASTRSVDALDLYSSPEMRAEALAAGVTAHRVQAGSDAGMGGIGAVLHTDPSSEPAILLDDACLAASCGITRAGNVMDVFDRAEEVERLVVQLQKGATYGEQVIEYRHELEEWEKAIAEKRKELEDDFKKAAKKRDKEIEEAKEKGKEFKEEKYKEDKKPREPRYDPNVEVLARVADGVLPLVVEAHRAPELRGLLEETKTFDRLRMVLAGATQLGAMAEMVAERNIPVLVWPTLEAGERPELAPADLSLAATLDDAGVEVLIGSGGTNHARDLRLLAAMAVAHGLDRDAALHAITLGPARAFDVADRIGSLERGKSADIVLLSGDPLDSTSQVRSVVSRGRVIE